MFYSNYNKRFVVDVEVIYSSLSSTTINKVLPTADKSPITKELFDRV